jgi:hypothetical protein
MHPAHNHSPDEITPCAHPAEAHHLCLLRLHEAATVGSHPAIARVAACRRELRAAIPTLTEHVADEEWALRSGAAVLSGISAERRISTNLSQLRELRTILETSDRMVAEDGAADSVVLEGFCALVASCAEDWMRREAGSCPMTRAAATA